MCKFVFLCRNMIFTLTKPTCFIDFVSRCILIQFNYIGCEMRISQKKPFKNHKLGGGILDNVGEHLILTCIQSRLEDISRWRSDNIAWHLVPGPNDPNREGGLPSDQPEPPIMQFQVMSSKAGTRWPSEEFLKV